MSRKLWSVEISNFKGARRVFFPVRDGVTQIVGPNGAGKSSVLDAITGTLAGARHIDLVPLTTGELRGEVKLDLGDIEVIRRMTDGNAGKGGTLTVRAKDGSKWGQRELDVLFGDFSFDPLAFGRLKPEEQIVILQRLAGEDFCATLREMDEKIHDLTERRADAGRAVKRMGSVPAADKPVDPPSVDDALEALRLADEHNEAQRRKTSAIDRAAGQVEAARRAAERARLKVLELEEALGAARKLRDQETEEYHSCVALCESLPPPEDMQDTTAARALIAEAGAAARKCEEDGKRYQRWLDFRRLLDEQNALELAVGEARDARTKHLRSATLPVQGLEWSAEGVTLNGIPLAQASSSERLRACVRLGMALHPDLRLMLIREGSLLDETAFAEVAALAEAEGYEVLMEVVGRAHEGPGQVIEIREGRSEWTPFDTDEKF